MCPQRTRVRWPQLPQISEKSLLPKVRPPIFSGATAESTSDGRIATYATTDVASSDFGVPADRPLWALSLRTALCADSGPSNQEQQDKHDGDDDVGPKESPVVSIQYLNYSARQKRYP